MPCCFENKEKNTLTETQESSRPRPFNRPMETSKSNLIFSVIFFDYVVNVSRVPLFCLFAWVIIVGRQRQRQCSQTLHSGANLHTKVRGRCETAIWRAQCLCQHLWHQRWWCRAILSSCFACLCVTISRALINALTNEAIHPDETRKRIGIIKFIQNNCQLLQYHLLLFFWGLTVFDTTTIYIPKQQCGSWTKDIAINLHCLSRNMI